MPGNAEKHNAGKLFQYFYLIHYQLNMVIEDVMRGPLSRKEAALLFYLHAEGGKTASIPRKQVVDRLNDWFEATSSNVTKIIARLEAPPLNLVQVTNEPGSARDKRISLSPEGRTFVRSMLRKGEEHSDMLLEGLTDEQIQVGLEFYKTASTYTNSILPLKKLALGRADRKR
jgi:DNA-binding MarR family transcriptional regulator